MYWCYYDDLQWMLLNVIKNHSVILIKLNWTYQSQFTLLSQYNVNVEWHIGSTHGSGARGPGFDSHPDPDGFIGSLISLLSDNRCKNNFINL
jgi:hypothetical protein